MDRILRSWGLLRESFAVLWPDMETLWLSIYSALALFHYAGTGQATGGFSLDDLSTG